MTHPHPGSRPPLGSRVPFGSWARRTPTPRLVGPPNGRVAQRGGGGVGLSTPPQGGGAAGPGTLAPTASGTLAPTASGAQVPADSGTRVPTAFGAWGVVVGGTLFLLARPTLGGSRFAVPLLALGYLGLLVGSLAVRGNALGGTGAAPFGWGVPLLLGLVGVVGAAVVGGPVADRRAGGVVVGLALGAAVAEEALFRRVLYERLLRFGVVAAVVGSAGVFALVHLPAYGVAAMPVDLGAALLLSWQRYASGRWTVPAVTHAVANFLAVT
jgi:membrane protease YdiL (CAAX protease family)